MTKQAIYPWMCNRMALEETTHDGVLWHRLYDYEFIVASGYFWVNVESSGSRAIALKALHEQTELGNISHDDWSYDGLGNFYFTTEEQAAFFRLVAYE